MTKYNTLDRQIFTTISNMNISGKSISWGFVERICSTFEDILEVVQHCINIGACFNGIPSERTEKYLIEKGINLRSLME